MDTIIKEVDKDKDKEEEEEKEDNDDNEEEEDNNIKEEEEEEEAQRAKKRSEGSKGSPEGPQTRSGARRAPKLLVIYIYWILFYWALALRKL